MPGKTPPQIRTLSERRFRLRKPFALKLVGVLVALTVGASLWQGMRDYALLRRRLDDVKNRSGIRFARQLAFFIPTFWYTTGAQGNLIEVDQAQLEKGRKHVETRLREHAATEAGKEILDIVIFSAEKEDTFYASLSGRASFQWRELETLSVPYAQDLGVTIKVGEKEGRAVRSFTAPIVRDGQTLGRVVVYLSAEELKAAEKRLWRSVTGNMILGGILAGIVSVLLGSLLSRPLKQLAADMRAVSTGDLERRTAVRTADEIGDLARTFNHMVASLKEVQERRAAQRAMEKELGIARRIQKSLLPETLPTVAGWDCAARWIPAKEVGGDYFDMIPLEDNKWALCVADVSGKGVPAALIMSMTRCLLRLATRAGLGPAGTLQLVDDVLAPDLKGGMFVSMVFVHLTGGSGHLQLVRAGHNPPVVVRAGGRKVELCQVPGVAVGLSGASGAGPLPEKALQLSGGDVLALYSDGIVEAMNEKKQEYGLERLAQVLARGRAESAAQLADAVLKQVAAFRGTAPQSDDITLLVLKRKSR